MIAFNRTDCGGRLKVTDDLAGHEIKCRHCDERQDVPMPHTEADLDTSAKSFLPVNPANSRSTLSFVLNVFRVLVWIGCLFYAANLLSAYPGILKTAQTAPQQAFVAADACFWLIGGYILARAADKVLQIGSKGN